MKRLLLAASIALALSPVLAFAAPAPQPQPQHWSHDRHDRGDHDRRDERHDHDRRGDWNRRGDWDRHDRRPVYRHDNGRHLGWYKQSFRRGQRMPVVYLQPRYYVRDYRTYGLAPPPYGYQWVRPYGNTNEYLLVQLATGLITQVLGY
jgi:Ni/Co efflux regulator RcnB